MDQYIKKSRLYHGKKDGATVHYRIQGDLDLTGELFNVRIDPARIQSSTAVRDQQNTAISQGSSETDSGDTITAFLKKIAKQILSIINIHI